jgi:hypothetical protein
VPACLSSPIPAAAHAAAPAALTSDQCRSLLEDLAQLAADAPGQVLAALRTRRGPLTGAFRPPGEATVRRVLARVDPDALDRAIGQWLTRQQPPPPASRPPPPQRAVAVEWQDPARQRPPPRRAGAPARGDGSCHRRGPGPSRRGPHHQRDRPVPAAAGASGPHRRRHHRRRPPHPSEHANWLVTHKHADYLLLVKANQPTLHRQLQRLPWPQVPVADHTHNRGHGRVEVRRLQVTTIAGLDFPHATQALRITRRVRPLHGRRWRTVTVYAITSLTAAQARPARMADYIRGHWGIEALHHIRDVTLAEDASQVCTRTAPRPMASLRNLAIAVLGAHGHRNIAAALRYTPATPPASYPARHHQPVNPTSPHLPRPWDRGCRVAERSYLMPWLSLAHAQGLGSRTCRQERRASKRRIGLARPGNSMAPSPSKRTPATEVIATTGSLTSTWPPRA